MSSECNKTIIVDDTSAIITGLPRRLPGTHLAPSTVIQEVKDAESRRILEESIELGRLNTQQPEPTYTRKARNLARKHRLLNRLSRTDLDVLALALMLREECPESRIIIATDDLRLADLSGRTGFQVITIRYKPKRKH